MSSRSRIHSLKSQARRAELGDKRRYLDDQIRTQSLANPRMSRLRALSSSSSSSSSASNHCHSSLCRLSRNPSPSEPPGRFLHHFVPLFLIMLKFQTVEAVAESLSAFRSPERKQFLFSSNQLISALFFVRNYSLNRNTCCGRRAALQSDTTRLKSSGIIRLSSISKQNVISRCGGRVSFTLSRGTRGAPFPIDFIHCRCTRARGALSLLLRKIT